MKKPLLKLFLAVVLTATTVNLSGNCAEGSVGVLLECLQNLNVQAFHVTGQDQIILKGESHKLNSKEARMCIDAYNNSRVGCPGAPVIMMTTR